jgi:hypothetical protein
VVPRDQLECFLHLVERLGQKRLIKTAGLQPEFSFRFHHQHGAMFAAREPDPEDLESYLLPFRQLLLQKEPASLGRINNILAQGLTNDELRSWLNESRHQWKRALQHGGMRLVIREKEITPEYATDLWINGYYFHTTQKLEELQRFTGPFEAILVRNRFLNHVYDATMYALNLRNIAMIAVREGHCDFARVKPNLQ